MIERQTHHHYSAVAASDRRLHGNYPKVLVKLLYSLRGLVLGGVTPIDHELRNLDEI
jgi:hypothetical protein